MEFLFFYSPPHMRHFPEYETNFLIDDHCKSSVITLRSPPKQHRFSDLCSECLLKSLKKPGKISQNIQTENGIQFNAKVLLRPICVELLNNECNIEILT